MTENDINDVTTFLNFSKDLIDLIPVNVNTLYQKQNKAVLPKHLVHTPKGTAPKTNSELKQRLQNHLDDLKNSRSSKTVFNEAEKLARQNKKLLKRQAKKEKRKRLLSKQKDGGEVKQNLGNLKKVEKSVRKEAKVEVEKKVSTESEFNKMTYITGNESNAQGGLVATKNEKFCNLQGKASKKLLKSAESFKKRLTSLEKSDPERAEQLKTDHEWNKASLASQGIKINDDVSKIKKTLNVQKKKREKSKQKWKEHDDKLQKGIDERQNKRKSNIQGRIDNKKAKKMKGLQKRGRIL